MSVDLEEILGRELHDVASGLHVPPMPALPREEPRTAPRHRTGMLVAAVIILVVAAAVAIEAIGGGSRELDPAPPVPTPGQSQSDAISTAVPATPYVLGERLYVGGKEVLGNWWSVQSGPEAWLAHRAHDGWWWGTGTKPHRIGDDLIGSTAISPSGRYVAEVLGMSGEGDLTGFDTRPGGEGLSGTPIQLGDPSQGNPVYLRAVTDDGRVIAQGQASSVLWRPLVDGGTVDLSETAPDQWVLGNTPAGLVVTDGVDGPAYLAEISDDGVLTRTGDLPDLDSWSVSPASTWLAWTPAGSLAGEVEGVSTLQLQTVGGTARTSLAAPRGWLFQALRWSWEDDDHLVSVLVRDDGSSDQRLARCSASAGRCVLVASS
ncbi:hypothetical protein ASC77_05845 [Nocardioides sp. Root1257]|uniref:hypothetical protein n=1 Tax=unclassified Nocardioides TaxID=2615069 RepID=UPI0006FE9661|nr:MULTISPECIES: hypothetical protein [unclassified Nocardioides]KQW53775.1 hypothetical protein ASC77_05845 [Nocardioides sp. Root1257]KRC56461.1 hypothetical protein ASE24_05845 [Nocardioides sp. Root224]